LEIVRKATTVDRCRCWLQCMSAVWK